MRTSKKSTVKYKIDRGSVLVAGMFLTLIFGVIDWCIGTTFRAMSDWMLYAVNIAATLLLSLPALLLRRVWIQLLIMVLVDIMWIANIMYCRTYFTAIPPESYALISNLADFTASVTDSLRWADIFLPLITLITGAAAYLTPATRPWPRRSTFIYVTLAATAVTVVGILCRGGFYKSYDKLAQSCYYSTCGVPTYSIAGHIAYSLMNSTNADNKETYKEIESWLNEKEVSRPYRQVSDSVISRRQNLVLILLESFESWLIDSNVKGQVITPYLNNLITKPNTLYAPYTLTQVSSGRSIDAQLLIGSGLLPMLNSVYSMKYPQYEYPSLMKAIKQQRGGRSVILSCDKPITWNQEVIARSMGYDSLLHRSAWNLDELIGNPAKLSDGSFLRQSVEKLRTNQLGIDGKPFLLTFITYSGHNPFKLPDNMKDKGLQQAVSGFPERLADYILMAHYTDSQLHTLIDYLQSRPDADQTLIVITGDHEGLAGDRDAMCRATKEYNLVSPEQFTPFIVLNSPVGGRINEVIGQVDLYPTLLDLLGLNEYSWKGVGENILQPRNTPAAISSMTGKMLGDTISATPAAMHNLKSARRVSDMIISSGYRLTK
ncbi:MAG: LTA synthase family protein [Bacteroides sp.]|nr:LTA synthase family protein [Bacteroides sp.]